MSHNVIIVPTIKRYGGKDHEVQKTKFAKVPCSLDTNQNGSPQTVGVVLEIVIGPRSWSKPCVFTEYWHPTHDLMRLNGSIIIEYLAEEGGFSCGQRDEP